MSILKTTISVSDTIEIPAPIIGDNGCWYEWDVATDTFRDTGIRAQGDPGEDVDPALLEDILRNLQNNQKLIQNLEKLTEQLKKGKLDSSKLPPNIKWLLQAFNQGETTIAGGLLLTRIIGLGDQDGKTTAYLSGNTGDGKVLRAGIKLEYGLVRKITLSQYLDEIGCDLSTFPSKENWAFRDVFFSWAKRFPAAWKKIEKALNDPSGDVRLPFDRSSVSVNLRDDVELRGFKPSDTERVAIYHDGRGHFGDIYLEGDVIQYKQNLTAKPYLSVGATDSEYIEDFIRGNRSNDTPIVVSQISLSDSSRTFSRSLDAIADGTRLTIRITKLIVRTYPQPFGDKASKLVLYLDGTEVASWQGTLSPTYTPDPGFDVDHGNTPNRLKEGSFDWKEIPCEDEDLTYSLLVAKGSHTLRLAIVGENGGTAEVTGLRVSRYYDSGQTQTYIRGSGLRFFGSADRFVDIDYRKTIYKYVDLNGTMVPDRRSARDNPYMMRVKGGVKVDKLVAEEVEMPGAILCGGAVKNGVVNNSFGKYKNKYGASYPVANFDKNSRVYRVLHSIGHTNYVPMVTMTQGAWCDLPHVVSVDNYSFDVKFINSENVASQYAWDFNYVCYKGDS